MMAVDTSALMAVLLDEPEAGACLAAMATAETLIISAGSAAEARIVAARRGVGREMTSLLDGLGFTVIDVTAATAGRIAAAYGRWGKGIHPAALNFGDCFAYDAARDHDCALLYVGDDFSRTDVKRAI